MTVGLKAAYDCVSAFSETDFTDDLRAIDVPMIIAQGDDDQIVPIKDAAMKSIDLVRTAELKVYPVRRTASRARTSRPSTGTSSPSSADRSPTAGRSDLWDRLFTGPRPRELHPCRTLTGATHTASSTPGDLFVHLRAPRMDLRFELARQLVGGGGPAMEDATSAHLEVHAGVRPRRTR
jgi:hypothetical protein